MLFTAGDLRFFDAMMRGTSWAVLSQTTDIEKGYLPPILSIAYKDYEEIEFIGEMILSRYGRMTRNPQIYVCNQIYYLHIQLCFPENHLQDFLRLLSTIFT